MALPPSRNPRQRPLTASALKMSTAAGGGSETMQRLSLDWQERALQYYDEVGELRYAAQFYARMLKQLRIYPAMREPGREHGDEIKEGLPVDLMERIQDPGGGRSQMQWNYGRLMFITGEGYLLGRRLNTDDERWDFVWKEGLRIERGVIKYKPSPNGDEETYGPGDAIAYKMWTPHPRWPGLADSPMRAALDIAEELIILTRSVRSTAVSRLVRSGMLLIPQEIEPPPQEPVGDEDPLNSPLLRDLVEHVTGAVENPGTAEATVPFILFGGAEWLDKVKKIEMHNPDTDYLERDLREEAIKRLALSLDMPPEILLGMADANHWCTTPDTEIMTLDGWRAYDRIGPGTVALTLNHETGLSEWQPVQEVATFDVTNLEMMKLEGSRHSSITTLNHRWPVVLNDGTRRWTVSEALNTNNRLVAAAPSADLPIKPVHSDSFVELVSWLWTDGQCRYREGRLSPQVFIHQSHTAHPERVERIRSRIKTWLGPASGTLGSGGRGTALITETRWREHQRENGMTVFSFNAAAGNKLAAVAPHRIVGKDFIRQLTHQQLELFLEASMLGDGDLRLGVIRASSPEMLEAAELAAILLGKSTNITSSVHEGFETHTMWRLSVSDRAVVGPRGRRESRVQYSGVIWCPVTANTTWLARRKGKAFFTGNTAWQISDEVWRWHGAPIAEHFCDDLSEVYLQPALREAGFPEWRNVCVHYDATEILVNVNRSEDADEAWDRGAIGYDAYRRAKNFNVGDAQTKKEHDEWLLVKGKNSQRERRRLTPDEPREPIVGEPPPAGSEPVRERDGNAASARILGAAEMALIDCRKKAGARARTLKAKCPDCLTEVNGRPNSQVVALLGPEGLKRLGAPDPRDLVSGGSDEFRDLLVAWGLHVREAASLAGMVESYAAHTLYDLNPTAIPSTLAAHVQTLERRAA